MLWDPEARGLKPTVSVLCPGPEVINLKTVFMLSSAETQI